MSEPEMIPDSPSPGRRTPFEWSLAALRPTDSDATRPSFLFRAGQESRERAVRFWRYVAAGCLMSWVGVIAVGAYWMADFRERGAVSFRGEGSRVGLAPPSPSGRGDRGVGNGDPNPLPPKPFPLAGEGSQSPSPPTSLPKGGVVPSPTPAEFAAALRIRRDILVAGLGMIPNPNPDLPGDSEPHLTIPPTLYAAPKIPPRQPPIPETDVPPIPEPFR
jgi:hypothetical protein